MDLQWLSSDSENGALAVKDFLFLVVKRIVFFVTLDVVNVANFLALDDSVSEGEFVLLVTQAQLNGVAVPVSSLVCRVLLL